MVLFQFQTCKKVDDKWTKKMLQRMVDENPDLFEINEDKVTLPLQTTALDYEGYRTTRTRIVHNLEKFLVGPFEENEILRAKEKTDGAIFHPGNWYHLVLPQMLSMKKRGYSNESIN